MMMDLEMEAGDGVDGEEKGFWRLPDVEWLIKYLRSMDLTSARSTWRNWEEDVIWNREDFIEENPQFRILTEGRGKCRDFVECVVKVEGDCLEVIEVPSGRKEDESLRKNVFWDGKNSFVEDEVPGYSAPRSWNREGGSNGPMWEKDIIWDIDAYLKENPERDYFAFKLDLDGGLGVEELPEDEDVPDGIIFPGDAKDKGKGSKKPGRTRKNSEVGGEENKENKLQQQARSTSDPTDINFFNISNDQFYQSNGGDDEAELKLDRLGDLNLLHSRLVRTFIPPFIPPYLSKEDLQHFHRPKLRNAKNPPVPDNPDNLHFVLSATRRILGKQHERKRLRESGKPILFDEPIDLSGKDGEILFIENCEEYPPLMTQVGMCSRITNYYRRNKSLKNNTAFPPPRKYGETAYINSLPSPYMGSLKYEETLSALENNLYCSPIYPHEPVKTDFLLMRNKHGYVLREVDGTFVAGQQCPLVEVPKPNSVKARSFVKALVQVFTFRQFLKCTTIKKKVKLTDIIRHFPNVFESNVRTWLKPYADIERVGSIVWVTMKSDFRLPSEEELEARVSPEEACAHYSMLAAEHRLKEAGCDSILVTVPEVKAGEKPKGNLNATHQSKLEEELSAAPWNTTAAFISASRGKCLLQIDGPIDPTGCGEGFSYVRISKCGGSVAQAGEKKLQEANINVVPNGPRPGGTDADLRRLSTKAAREILKKSGLPEKDVQKLTRWEVIDVLKNLSAEKAKEGGKDMKGILKYSRWKNKNSRAMNQERFTNEYQRIFELQNKILSSEEILSSDEDDDDEEAGIDKQEEIEREKENMEQIGKSIEKILNDGKSKDEEDLYEEEERERVQLQLMMLGKVKAADADILRKEKQAAAERKRKELSERDSITDFISRPGRILKLVRRFDNDGETSEEVEIVRDPAVIIAYLTIRKTKSDEFIKDYLKKANLKERKERRQQQKEIEIEYEIEQSREESKLAKWRIKRKRDLETEYFPNKSEKEKAERQLKTRPRKRRCAPLKLSKVSFK